MAPTAAQPEPEPKAWERSTDTEGPAAPLLYLDRDSGTRQLPRVETGLLSADEATAGHLCEPGNRIRQ
jgi:hypothetical protein